VVYINHNKRLLRSVQGYSGNPTYNEPFRPHHGGHHDLAADPHISSHHSVSNHSPHTRKPKPYQWITSGYQWIGKMAQRTPPLSCFDHFKHMNNGQCGGSAMHRNYICQALAYKLRAQLSLSCSLGTYERSCLVRSLSCREDFVSSCSRSKSMIGFTYHFTGTWAS
jgi:hypothetical protein